MCQKQYRNVDSNELRHKVEKLKTYAFHCIAKNFFIKCHKTNFMEEIALNSNLLMHISNHMQYRAFPQLLISGINFHLHCWMLMILKHLKIQYLDSIEISINLSSKISCFFG